MRVPEEDEGQESGVLDDLKVLVVDDDESSCTHAGMLLKRWGLMRSGFSKAAKPYRWC